jgi:hypothetical protein
MVQQTLDVETLFWILLQNGRDEGLCHFAHRNIFRECDTLVNL